MKHYYIFTLTHGNIVNHGDRVASIEQLQSDFPASDGWLVIPTADLPADFSVDTYTIENGQPVRASDEQIAERKATATVAKHESIRAQREERYNREEISSMYWDWVESGLEYAKEKWIAAKDAVRKELPYPEKEGGN